MTYLGAETAQIFLQIPQYTGQVFQGMILFFLLASDYLLFFKLNFKFKKMSLDISFIGILIGSIMASSVPLILAASGELITERSGV